ncbi:DUF7684 family protein [Shewanella woodyi]|uniref:DUF7684 domain-containing protein n=1 Tax=Shewanella woodyi (strain ATCC 51908 / MS32) TaxID=392500 RepID=B1KFV0_SHEWM|nr:hypothetical protein [Shewanella woodyi]ACA85266.1 conserved hypothetical protein [Shewanella woodyi ATCC 51908]
MEYVQLTKNTILPDISKLGPFRCIVVVEKGVPEVRQKEVSAWLVESGCLYMMAWGIECGSWDTSVDIANLEKFDFNEIPEENLIITIWHNDEPLSEVFWYSKHCAFHSTVEIENTVLLNISAIDKSNQYLSEYINA